MWIQATRMLVQWGYNGEKDEDDAAAAGGDLMVMMTLATF